MLARPTGSSAALDLPASPNPSFSADVASGTWQVMLVVRDQLGNASTPKFFTAAALTSDDCGARLPVVTVAPNPVADAKGFMVQALSASAPDPESGCPLRFKVTSFTWAWSLITAPAAGPQATLTSSGSSAQLTPRAPGAYVVRAVATGSDGVSGAGVSNLTSVCGYHAPAIGTISGSQSGPTPFAPPAFNNGQAITFSGPALDADNDPVGCNVAPPQGQSQHWTVTAAPPGSLAQLTAADTAAPRLVPDVPGSYTISETASDDKGFSSSKSFAFTVTAACGGHAPAAVDTGATPAFSA